MRSRKSVRNALVVLGIVPIVVLAAVLLLSPGDTPAKRTPPRRTFASTPTTPSFVGDSTELEATVILPTLDSPIPPGKNAIWCASFVAAWKTLESNVAKGPIGLTDPPPLLKLLNSAPDPRPDIPPESLYVAAGWNDKGILDKIRRDLAARFPAKPMPTFPGILPDSFVVYAYLEANVTFSFPYFPYHVAFTPSDKEEKEALVTAFGIRPGDSFKYPDLRLQPAILYEIKNQFHLPADYVIDLDHASTPNQVIVARMERKATLAETVRLLDEVIAAGEKDGAHNGIAPGNTLLVPDVSYIIKHRLRELEGHCFTNATLKEQRIDIVTQETAFSLSRKGAELKSEAMGVAVEGMPGPYIFNRPFLICMKKRGAKDPYFVMWVDNAELLQPWPADRK